MIHRRHGAKGWLLGVPQSGYPIERNITGSVPAWMRTTRPIDAFRIASALRYRLRKEVRFGEQFRFRDPYFPRVDLLHFFNTVAESSTPWITTFEHCMPRWRPEGWDITDRQYRVGAELMAADSCRCLLAFSDASRNVARNEWKQRLDSAMVARLEAKVQTLLPPQPVILDFDSKPKTGVPLLVFVGADFYRKGGLEALGALDRLRERGIRGWRAVFVGRLDSFGDYASGTDASSRDRAHALLARLAGQVQHMERVGPREVLELMCGAHYYLFPTLADTFGYSALEAMACGAVVITTNVRAMAEVVDSQVGYALELPLDENRDAHTTHGFAAAKKGLEAKLEQVLEAALTASTAERGALARAATERLRLRHDPAAHRAATELVYLRALGISAESATSAKRPR